jgi:O-antigen/teichoic acid export membrane protein
MEVDSLSYRTLKNVSYSLVGYVAPIVFTIFVTPVILHRLGLVDYGIYLLTVTIMGFLGYFDLGLSTSVSKFTAEYHSQGDFKKLQDLLRSAATLYTIIGAVGFVAFVLLGSVLVPLFHVSESSQRHLFIVFLLSGVVFLLNSWMSIGVAVAQALQRFDITTKINLSLLTGTNIFSLILVLLGYKLKAILMGTIVTTGIAGVAYYWSIQKLLPQVRFGFSWVAEEIKKAYGFGFLAFIGGISTTALYSLDRLIIPMFLGPVQLTYYSLPGNIAQKTAGFTGSIGYVFFPVASALSAQEDHEKVKAVYRRTVRNVTIVATALTCAAIVFAYQLLYFWVGKDIADQSWRILVILAMTNFFVALYSPLTSYLLGMGKVKFLSIFSSGLAVLNLAALLILVPRYGIMGAAYAYLISVVPVIFMFAYAEKYFFGLVNQWRFYGTLYLKVGIVSAAYIVAARLLLVPLVTSLAWLVVIGPLSICAFFALYKIFGFYDPEDWAIITEFGKHIKLRIVQLFSFQKK